jgi:hypothetical protein
MNMKKILIALFCIIAIDQKDGNAQIPLVNDTLDYLETIVNRKAEFIGRPFSVLKDSLQFQIRYFHPREGIVYDITKETSTKIAFYFPQVADDMYLTYPSLEIYWQTALNATQSNELYRQTDGGGWSSTVAAFYSNAIIKDIKLRE